MTRIAKAPDVRRSELVASARRLFYTKGYERTSVSDIVRAVGVAQGTFYYYFDSKTAVLEAMVDELVAQGQSILQAIVADEALTAISKWTRAMQATGNWKLENKTEMIEVLRLTMRQDNVLLQHKLRTQVTQMTSREIAKIVAQGIEEGVFATQFTEETAEIVMAIAATLSETMGELLLHPDKYDDRTAIALRRHAAAQTAIERVLGAPPGSLPMIDENTMRAWFAD